MPRCWPSNPACRWRRRAPGPLGGGQRWHAPDSPIVGRHVLLLDEICDSGNTLASLEVCLWVLNERQHQFFFAGASCLPALKPVSVEKKSTKISKGEEKHAPTSFWGWRFFFVWATQNGP